MIKQKHSLLHHRLDKFIKDKFQRLNKDKIDPWKFFNAGKNIKIQKYDGSWISYGGIKFSGSCQSVFWSTNFIPPFIEAIVSETVAWIFSQSEENKLPPESPLNEASELLKAQVENSYKKMSGIDQRLRGEGFPDREPLRNVNNEIDRMSQFIDEHILSEKKLWKSRQENDDKITKATKVGEDKIHAFPPHKIKDWSHVQFCALIEKACLEVDVDGEPFSESVLTDNGFTKGNLSFLYNIVLNNGFFDKDSFLDDKNLSQSVARLNKSLKKIFIFY